MHCHCGLYQPGHRIGALIAGNWRISSLHYYASGQPLAITTTTSTPAGLFAGANRPIISTYEGWSGSEGEGGFDPSRDRFIQPASFFPTQVSNSFGNMTRYNPQFRQFANLNENISIAKSFVITERVRLDLRGEAFNVLNRVRFGPPITNPAAGSLSLQSQTFGLFTSSGDLLNTPRQLQVALKLYF